jgi:hypothetical protein
MADRYRWPHSAPADSTLDIVAKLGCALGCTTLLYGPPIVLVLLGIVWLWRHL